MIGNNKKLTKADFVARAEAKHGKAYDYSAADYKGVKCKLTIICPQHGAFEQEAGSHLNGCGCRKCGWQKAGLYLVPTKEEFVSRAVAKHGAIYDYSAVNYTGDKGKLAIFCPAHGIFEQSAGNHLQGQGCPRCGFKKSGRYAAVSPSEFIKKAISVHGLHYGYGITNYERGTVKVKISCPLHGVFEQLPGQHLLGKGCPTCGHIRRKEKNALTWLEKAKDRPAILYFLRLFNGAESFYKIGITFHSVNARYHSSSLLAGYQYELLASYTSTNAKAVWDWEQSIIETFAHLKYVPINTFHGGTECFSSADEILQIFPL